MELERLNYRWYFNPTLEHFFNYSPDEIQVFETQCLDIFKSNQEAYEKKCKAKENFIREVKSFLKDKGFDVYRTVRRKKSKFNSLGPTIQLENAWFMTFLKHHVKNFIDYEPPSPPEIPDDTFIEVNGIKVNSGLFAKFDYVKRWEYMHKYYVDEQKKIKDAVEEAKKIADFYRNEYIRVVDKLTEDEKRKAEERFSVKMGDEHAVIL